MSSEGGEYIHGTHDEERQRLARLNDLLNARALRDLALEPADRVLDVGSGLGLLTQEIARRVGPHGAVLGIERDKVQLAAALQGCDSLSELAAPVEYRRGDAMNLPLRPGEWGRFDIAHCRFVLEHVPEPERVVEGMAQAVRTGGRVVLEDDDHDLLRLWPPVPEFEALWAAYIESYRLRGNDPFIGRKLVELMHRAGLQPERLEPRRFGSCHGADDWGTYLDNLDGLLAGAEDDIVAAGGLDSAAVADGRRAISVWGERPGATLFYITCWAEGRRVRGGAAA